MQPAPRRPSCPALPSFNPHSAQGMNATAVHQQRALRSHWFQSSFSPRDECNSLKSSRCASAVAFQSSFSPRDECNERWIHARLASCQFQSSFSPRDECNTQPHHPSLARPRFQSSFSPRDECNRYVPALRPRPGRFNPHSAQGMNATPLRRGRRVDDVRVSILIQPKG